MFYVYAILMCMMNAGWLGLVFFYLPGNWLIVLTTGALAWWQRDISMISAWTVGVMAALAMIGEIIEFLAGMGGARKAGAGWVTSLAAVAGALFGAVAGTVLIPIPFAGTLLGACLGAGLVTWGLEQSAGKKKDQSMRSGVGAGVGVFVGTAVKIAIGITLWLIAAVAAFF